jgi:hypothetical protein
MLSPSAQLPAKSRGLSRDQIFLSFSPVFVADRQITLKITDLKARVVSHALR